MPMQNKKRLRNDFFLIGGILLLAVLGGLCLMLFRGQGDRIAVTINGAPYAEYSLSEDRVEEIHTGDDQRNLLVIRDGKAFIEEATCPDGICAAHRPISRNGESIVCLPHRVVVSVISEKDGEEPDMVV